MDVCVTVGMLSLCLCLGFIVLSSTTASTCKMGPPAKGVSNKPGPFVPGIMTGLRTPKLKRSGQPVKNTKT